MNTIKGVRTRIMVSGVLLAVVVSTCADGYAQQTPTAETPGGQNQVLQVQPNNQDRSNGQSAATGQQLQNQPSDQLPDSPGSIQAKAVQPQPEPVAQQDPPAPDPPQTRPREPMGTAAAQTVPTMGIAASRPAGAALAPAKQRRVRSILIKMGVIVGVGVAVGTTVALSEGSPSKPPGSH